MGLNDPTVQNLLLIGELIGIFSAIAGMLKKNPSSLEIAFYLFLLLFSLFALGLNLAIRFGIKI